MTEPGDPSSRQLDLSGYWSGEYWYDAGMGVLTQFAAHLQDHGGRLDGTTLESADFGSGMRELTAQIWGSCDGTNVEFVKRYDAGQGVHGEPIFYAGVIDADQTVIDGQWTLTEWVYRLTGGFRMTRGTRGAAAAVKREAREPVLVGAGSRRKQVVVTPGTRRRPKPPKGASRWLDAGVLGGARRARYVTGVS